MKDTQNSVPCVEVLWAKDADVTKKSTAAIKMVNLVCFMASKFLVRIFAAKIHKNSVLTTDYLKNITFFVKTVFFHVATKR